MTALDERARLFAELATVRASADTATRAQADATRALADLDARSSAVYQDRARGRATDDDVHEFEVERVMAKRAAGLAQDASQGALDARRAIEGELHELYARALPEFASEAEQATQAAAKALAALQAPYSEALAAWAVAAARWRPLAVAVRDEVEQGFTARGQYPDATLFSHLANLPVCPLPAAGEVFGGAVARPRGLTPDGTPAVPASPEEVAA